LRDRRTPEAAADEDAILGSLEQLGARQCFEDGSQHVRRQTRSRHQIIRSDRVARLEIEQDVVQAIPTGIAPANISHHVVSSCLDDFRNCRAPERRRGLSKLRSIAWGCHDDVSISYVTQPCRQPGRAAPVAYQRQSHGGQPLSKTIFHAPPGSRRHTELKVPTRFPCGSRTGPLLKASMPESSTSTRSGSQENGARGPSYKRFQPDATAALPRSTSVSLKNTASSARNDANVL